MERSCTERRWQIGTLTMQTLHRAFVLLKCMRIGSNETLNSVSHTDTICPTAAPRPQYAQSIHP